MFRVKGFKGFSTDANSLTRNRVCTLTASLHKFRARARMLETLGECPSATVPEWRLRV